MDVYICIYCRSSIFRWVLIFAVTWSPWILIPANLNMHSIYVASSACSANFYTRELIWAQLAACKYVCTCIYVNMYTYICIYVYVWNNVCYERWESRCKFINIKKGLWNKVANLNPPYYIIYSPISCYLNTRTMFIDPLSALFWHRPFTHKTMRIRYVSVEKP